jgi:hypothetical protein
MRDLEAAGQAYSRNPLALQGGEGVSKPELLRLLEKSSIGTDAMRVLFPKLILDRATWSRRKEPSDPRSSA